MPFQRNSIFTYVIGFQNGALPASASTEIQVWKISGTHVCMRQIHTWEFSKKIIKNQFQGAWAIEVRQDINSGQSSQRQEKLVGRFIWRKLFPNMPWFGKHWERLLPPNQEPPHGGRAPSGTPKCAPVCGIHRALVLQCDQESYNVLFSLKILCGGSSESLWARAVLMCFHSQFVEPGMQACPGGTPRMELQGVRVGVGGGPRGQLGDMRGDHVWKGWRRGTDLQGTGKSCRWPLGMRMDLLDHWN